VRLPALAAQQVALFVAIEVAEHALSGIGPARTLTEASLLIGVVAQVLVAAGLVALVGWMRRAGELIAAVGRGELGRRPTSLRALRSCGVVAPGVVVWSLSRRGPPVRLAG